MATTALSDGGYVEYRVDPSGTSDPDTLHVQKHNADGSLAGPEYIHGTRDGATVLGLSNGGYVVAATEFAPGGTVLRGEVFAANGGHLSEFNAGKDWQIAVSDEGGFVVSSTFTTNRNFTQPDGLITLYDNDGHALTATGRVYSNGHTPTITVDSDGVFHAAWTDGTHSRELVLDITQPPDLRAPDAPQPMVIDDVEPGTGALGGGWTNDNTPTFRVPVHELGYAALSTNNSDPGTPRFEITAEDVARGYKDITLAGGPDSDDRLTVVARVEDADGMISSVGTMQITIDTQAPGQPTISHVTDDQGLQQGEVASGGTTDDTTPTFQIALPAGAQVNEVLSISDNGQSVLLHPIDAGDISRGYLTATISMAEGSHSITAQTTDQAGNQGAASAAFAFTVHNETSPSDHRPTIGDDSGIAGSHTFQEKNLPGGTAPDAAALSYSGSFSVTSADGLARLTIDGHVVVENDVQAFSGGPLTFRTGLGETLSITGYDANAHTVSYTYTLDTAVQHQQGGGPPPRTADDRPRIQAIDHDGDTANAILNFGVVDDMPTVTWDTATVAAGATLTGNLLANDKPGADGMRVANASDHDSFATGLDANGDYTVQGDHGVLHVKPNGDYSYVANAGAAAGTTDSFSVGVTDGDGSSPFSADRLDVTIGAAQGGGQTINSPGPGSTVSGTAGNDTINASQGPDVITGGAGADVIAFHDVPWSAGHVTDFAVGTDRLDLSAIFAASGYSGSNPVADGRMSLQDDGAGGTKIYFDRDQANGGDWPFLITTLDHVSARALTWAQLSGGTAGPQGQSVGLTTTSITQDEGNSGVTHYQFTVTRSGDASAQLSIHWSSQGWGNSQPTADDFSGGLMPVGSLTFLAGETSKAIDIGVVGDTTPEQDESFRLFIDDVPAGVTITSAEAVATIRNDDTGQTSGTPGQVYTANPPGATVVGGAGDDTINASQGADRLTGGAGNDDFVFRDLPWSHGHITDFMVGSDKLDFSAIFQAAGYTGTDPVADGRMRFQQDNLGNTTVYFDHDQTNGGDWPFQIVTLDHVSANGLTWAQLSTGGGSTGGGGDPGGGSTQNQVITSDQYGDTLVGGAGNDTLNAGQGPDIMSGNGGADHFVWNALPWRPGAVTDFTPGVDKLDLRPLFQAAGYSGTDPIADHHLQFRDDGQGNTVVYFDRDDPNGGDWPFFITTLQGVSAGQIGPGDWLVH